MRRGLEVKNIYFGTDLLRVAGPGVAPGLGDYEPPVLLYTTPHVGERVYFSTNIVWISHLG